MALSADLIIQAALAQGLTRADLLDALGASAPAHTGKGDAPAATGLDRYEDLGLLGVGGTGEVRRVRDRHLGRTLALKILRPEASAQQDLQRRFAEEARATAQLAHPGVVPVHDLGELPDGRVWFTMQEVSGRTLREVIATVHRASPDRWRTTPDGWSLRRLVDGVRQVCDTVAHAHSRRILHRDLKPDNVMVGAFGEVLVLDWGLAKVLGSPRQRAGDGAEPVDPLRNTRTPLQTQVGQVAGTPAYMAPEQAQADHARVDERTDIYALGALLYAVLTGRPPYEGTTSREVLQKVQTGPPPPLVGSSSPALTVGFSVVPEPEGRSRPEGPVLPPALVALCEQAMARDPAARFDSASDLSAELRAWLDGERRAEEARAVVDLAAEKQPQVATLHLLAAGLRAEAEALLRDVPSWAPEADKAAAWAKQDQAQTLEQQAAMTDLEQEQLLQASLTRAPTLPEAHAALAQRYRAQHAADEAEGRPTARAEALLRQHALALPQDHAEREDHLDYLRGEGALTLHTSPPGAQVELYRFVAENRRLVATPVGTLGPTPLDRVPLARGSYLCVLRHPGCEPVRYPVSIGRREHWDSRPPGEEGPGPVFLPPRGALGPADRYVPGGWFVSGGDPDARDGLALRRLWIEGWVFREDPVTLGAYLAFLHALVDEGRTEEALRHAPRERGGAPGELGALLCPFDGARFGLPRLSEDGAARWNPDWPAIMVDWEGARAYARHEAARTGLPWQLPPELAWEKAARGVDGRRFPWGDAFDPSWACMKDSHRGQPMPVPIDAFGVDASVYGIRGLCGNVKDWCADAWSTDGPPVSSLRVALDPPPAPSPASGQRVGLRVRRGGGWDSVRDTLRSASRDARASDHRAFDMGFRLARPVGGEPGDRQA